MEYCVGEVKLVKVSGRIIRVRLENGVFKPAEEIKDLTEGKEYLIHVIVPKKAKGLAKVLEEYEEKIEFTTKEFEEFVSERR